MSKDSESLPLERPAESRGLCDGFCKHLRLLQVHISA